jgi:hypothetical protein
MTDDSGNPTARSTQHLARTARGRAVLQDRSVPLSRAGRNLLLVLEPTQAASHWLGLVRGASQADLDALLDAGLVAPAASAASALAAVAVPRFVPAIALTRVDYGTLSSRLTAQARPQLGLVQGLRTVLEIERASDAAALQQVALKMVAQVEASKGEAAALALARTLAEGAPGTGH